MVLNAGTGGALRVGPQSRQLLRADPERTLQRRAAAAGANQQAGQFVSALLSSAGGAQASRAGQSSGGAQAGYQVVSDVARELELRATVQGRCAGEPESFCGRKTETGRLSRQPASPMSGEFEAAIVGARTEEMDGETLCPPRDGENTSLGRHTKSKGNSNPKGAGERKIKTLSSRLRRGVAQNCLDTANIVRDRMTEVRLRVERATACASGHARDTPPCG